jgi:hypothetical protein
MFFLVCASATLVAMAASAAATMSLFMFLI